MKGGSLLCLAAALMAAAPAAQARTSPTEPLAAKRRVEKLADLPVHPYRIAGKPSEVVQDPTALRALAAQLEQDVKGDLDTFEVSDSASLASLHSSLYFAAMLQGDFAAAGQHLEKVRSLQEAGPARHLIGLFAGPLIQAKLTPGQDYRATYRRLLTQRLAELPFKAVVGPLDRMRKAQRAASREQILAPLVAALDPQVKEGKLSEEALGAILNTGLNLHLLLPLQADTLACLEACFEAHHAELSEFANAKAPQSPLGTTQVNAKGAFFGQTPPGEKPVRFAPEALKAISPWASGIAFSPDGLECFLHVGDATYSSASLYTTKCVKGVWTPVAVPSFVEGFSTASEPVYSKDGNTLTFTGTKGTGSTDFWTVSRQGEGWGKPERMPAPLNSDANDFRGSLADDGTFYFGSERLSPGILQVFKATKQGQGWAVEKLGAPINALSYDGDPCIAPDGRFLITYGARPDSHGRVDLYVSFSDGKGGWGKQINLGPEFNSPDDEFGACLSLDGKWLYFNRHTAQGDQLYWVAVSAIDRLKP